jgi:hypothetical protein
VRRFSRKPLCDGLRLGWPQESFFNKAETQV